VLISIIRGCKHCIITLCSEVVYCFNTVSGAYVVEKAVQE